MAEKSPSASELEKKVLKVLSAATKPLKAFNVATAVGKKAADDVISTLIALEKQGLVRISGYDGQKPMWRIVPNSPQSSPLPSNVKSPSMIRKVKPSWMHKPLPMMSLDGGRYIKLEGGGRGALKARITKFMISNKGGVDTRPLLI